MTPGSRRPTSAPDPARAAPGLRQVALALLGILVGAAIITPGVGLAARFLTSSKANRTYVRYLSADRGASGTIFSGATPQFLNVTIKAPTDGFLLIQGSARFANLDDKGNDEATLDYQVDERPSVVAAAGTLGPNAKADERDPGETAQLAYVDVVPVDKGTHRVRSLIGASPGETNPPGVTGAGLQMSYSNAALVVTFFPGKGATVG